MTHLTAPPAIPKTGEMPPRQPVPMPDQCFGTPFSDPAAGTPATRSTHLQRVVFVASVLFAIATTLAVAAILGTRAGQPMGLLIIAATLPAAWQAGLTLACTAMGLRTRDPGPAIPPGPPLSVAILMPLREEDTAFPDRAATQLLRDLARSGSRHRYGLFILSDSATPDAVAAEWRLVDRLRAHAPPGIPVHYRRREYPTGYKAGNLRDWIIGWGGGWDAFVVLDADSLMGLSAIEHLADRLAADASAGLIQSVPRLLPGPTPFARLQAFIVNTYAPVYLRGMARIAGDCANYWGHNAIVRTRAFAASAGLPRLPGGRTILSHDFPEAALLRRAGWGVRLCADPLDSWETAPETIARFIERDRRWCRGNLQHLSILGAAGFHPVSRLHLFLGALPYLMTPVWVAVVVLLMADGGTGGAGVLPLILLALLSPKLLALAHALRRLPDHQTRARTLAQATLATSVVVLLAPLFLISQAAETVRAALAGQGLWHPQRRGAARGEPQSALLPETLCGAVLGMSWAAGLAPAWILLIATPLAAAQPLNTLTGFGHARLIRAMWRTRTTPPRALLPAKAALKGSHSRK